MRLVIEYGVGDDYTWWATVTVPVEYESAEAFAVEFEAGVKECRQDRRSSFYFADTEWDSGDFVEFVEREWKYTAPEIMTVDEWFARTKG